MVRPDPREPSNSSRRLDCAPEFSFAQYAWPAAEHPVGHGYVQIIPCPCASSEKSIFVAPMGRSPRELQIAEQIQRCRNSIAPHKLSQNHQACLTL
jgi:hypothetical protein